MQQTPSHDNYNPDLLDLIPANAKKILEIGCSTGALARAYKEINSKVHYVGIEIDPRYALLAERYCDACLVQDIELVPQKFWKKTADRDCWIFGDSLEHLKDPWSILANIRKYISADGCIVTCIPNAQHWSLQKKLSVGKFKYTESGLLDKTHLRWFTRITMIEMFEQTGFAVDICKPRIFAEPERNTFLPVIAQMAALAGEDPQSAVMDAIPLQYVFRVKPTSYAHER